VNHLFESLNSIFKQSWTRVTVALFFVVGTLFLCVETLEVQHSCNQMIKYSDSSIAYQYCPEPPPIPSEPCNQPKEKNYFISMAAASFTIGGLAIVGTPIIIIAGVGATVGLIVHSLINRKSGDNICTSLE
jgi:hypothetical protein